MRFRAYNHAHSLGHTYIFGLNIYRYRETRELTIDLIVGKHVFVTTIGGPK